MGLYVYCVVPIAHEPEAVVGIDQSAVSGFRWRDLGCWVSELSPRPEPTLERVKAHNAVVQNAVSNRVTPVPIRFGQWVDNTAALELQLQQNADRYRKLLKLFEGTLEFGLRVLDPSRSAAQHVSPATATTGRAYMNALRDQLRNAELDEPAIAELRTRLQTEFTGLTRAERFEPLRTTHGMLSVAHLVEHAAFDVYRERVQQVRDHLPHLRILASGPWPPYTFAA
jgi:hypothetical protein